MWTALVPLKQGDQSKSRLAQSLDHAAREQLSQKMARHVLGVLAGMPAVRQTVVLSPTRPDDPKVAWAPDNGCGLNAELENFRQGFGPHPLLIVHGDLPLLSNGDLTDLIAMAEKHGAALATDRAGQGTNALALADGRAFDFRFGANSRLEHLRQYPSLPVIERQGLAADLDTDSDLLFLRKLGFAS